MGVPTGPLRPELVDLVLGSNQVVAAQASKPGRRLQHDPAVLGSDPVIAAQATNQKPDLNGIRLGKGPVPFQQALVGFVLGSDQVVAAQAHLRTSTSA